jgi:hypothetical protein
MTAENTVINIIGKKALVTCNAWFYAPDGRQYRAAWGTIKAAINAEQALLQAVKSTTSSKHLTACLAM